MILIKGKTYNVTRVGPNTSGSRKGLEYVIVFEKDKWAAYREGKVRYAANGSTYSNERFWKINYCCEEEQEAYDELYDEEVPYKDTYQNMIENATQKEEDMSFDKVKTEVMVVEMGVILVNGSRLDKYTDDAVIRMIGAERAKLDTLAKDLGTGSKYYQAKAKAVDLNIQILADALDKRVES